MIKEIEYMLYSLQQRLGIKPKWEASLRSEDTKLTHFHREATSFRNDGWVCNHYKQLYKNRLNYLKGWNKEL